MSVFDNKNKIIQIAHDARFEDFPGTEAAPGWETRVWKPQFNFQVGKWKIISISTCINKTLRAANSDYYYPSIMINVIDTRTNRVWEFQDNSISGSSEVNEARWNLSNRCEEYRKNMIEILQNEILK